jgi:Fe2+ transport system protein B
MAILFLIFQAIFAWAQVPADLIDGAIAGLTGWMHERCRRANSWTCWPTAWLPAWAAS